MKFVTHNVKIGLSPVSPMNNLCPRCGSHLVKYTERVEVESKGNKVTYRDNISYRCDKCKTETGLDFDANPAKIKKRVQLSQKGFLTDIEITGNTQCGRCRFASVAGLALTPPPFTL